LKAEYQLKFKQYSTVC